MAALTRRTILAGLATIPVATAAPIPAGARLAFRAERNGTPIGTHVLDFSRAGDTMIVTIAIDYVVKFGPIPVFRYKLRATETWRGDTLASITAETNNDGEADFLRATRQGDALDVEGSKSGKYRAPAGAIAATHWNPRQLDGPMINPQTGELMRYTISAGAIEPVTMADGSTRPARRHSLAGPNPLDLWYDASGEWSSLRATAKDGSIIAYFRE